MNWENFKYIDYKTTDQKYGSKKYYQQYIVPSYYLSIHFLLAEKRDLVQLHNQLIDSLGHLFTWHQNYNKSRASKIRDRNKAFSYIPGWLEKPTGSTCWSVLTNVGGTGSMNNPEEYGGIGDARLEYWIARETLSPSNKKKQVQQYKEYLIHFNSDILNIGARISNITICIPIEHFKSTDDFFHWIMNLNLINQGKLSFATAGYRINYFEGYDNNTANKILINLLEKYPGFEFRGLFHQKLGRILNDDKTDFVTIINRLNWLTFVSEEGVQLTGGIQKLKDDIEKNRLSIIHPLEKGICIQATNKPALTESDEGFNQYYIINTALKKLIFEPLECDYFHFTKKEVLKDWFYKFHKRPTEKMSE